MSKEHLIPVTKGSERARELGKKGGSSKSTKKQISSRLNGLLASKKLTTEQRYIATLLKDKEYAKLINEFITINAAEGYKDPERRDKVIAQSQAMLPKTNVNVNLGEEHFMKVVMEVLIETGQDALIDKIHEKLKVMSNGDLPEVQTKG